MEIFTAFRLFNLFRVWRNITNIRFCQLKRHIEDAAKRFNPMALLVKVVVDTAIFASKKAARHVE